MDITLPPCGPYKTGVALSGHEDSVGADILVYFHNHSDQGPAMVLTPHGNTNNRWAFHDRGWAVEEEAFVLGLIGLKPEGLYVNSEHIHISREEIIPPRTLLQLGYNRDADTLLFIGRFEANTIGFPEQGYAFKTIEVQAMLEPAGFNVPGPKKTEELH
ncbi:MAG: hypothetical protein ACI8TX_003288 [Hyphomicrobiaceae bacterium]|jgi:hypothetical protein